MAPTTRTYIPNPEVLTLAVHQVLQQHLRLQIRPHEHGPAVLRKDPLGHPKAAPNGPGRVFVSTRPNKNMAMMMKHAEDCLCLS